MITKSPCLRAIEQGKSIESDTRSYYTIARFNIRTFYAILTLLLPELRKQTHFLEESSSVTDLIHRIVPPIRLYTAWLVYNCTTLVQVAAMQDHTVATPLSKPLEELFNKFAEVASALYSLFPRGSPVTVPYLMIEDEALVGFKPLQGRDAQSQWSLFNETSTDQPKSRHSEASNQTKYSPDDEMRSRFFDIFEGITLLANNQSCPILMTKSAQEMFVYAPSVSSHIFSDLERPNNTVFLPANDTSYGMHSATANSILAGIDHERRSADISRAEKSETYTTGMIGSLPGIINSPFTPQPDELRTNVTRFRPEASNDPASPLVRADSSLARNENTRTPALDAMQAGQELRRSLAQQYMPQSSDFSSSSMFWNTTPDAQRLQTGYNQRKGNQGNPSTDQWSHAFNTPPPGQGP